MRSTRLARVAALALLALVPAAFSTTSSAQGETADDRYGFLVGLCEEREWTLAAREARAFLAEFPGHAKAELARYRLGTALFELGSWEEARESFTPVARRDGFEFRPEALFRLGQCELRLGRAREASQAFEKVRAIPRSYLAVPADFFLGEAKLSAGDFAAAEASYQRVLAAEGSADYQRDARYSLVWCAFRAGRFDDAIARADEFAQRHAGDAALGELRYVQGESHLAANRPKEALASFARVKDGAHLERALRGAAFAAAQLGDHADAARRFALLLQRFPEGEFAGEAAVHRGIELVLAGEPSDAVAALQGRADGAEAGYWLARAHMEAGDANAALAAADAALARKPETALADRLHALRGDALASLGRAGEAAKSYARSQSDHALHAAAIHAFNTGEREEAARLARTLLERFPQSEYRAEMRIVAAEALLGAKRFAEAQREFEAAREESTNEATRSRAQSRVAWCRFLAGDPAGAQQAFAQLLAEHRRAPEAAEARYMIGRCCEQQGDAAGAVRSWREYVEASPRGEHAAQALGGLARLDAENSSRWSARLVAEFPDSASAAGTLFDLAERDAREGRREAARRGYAALLERFPEHELAPAARYGLGWCAYEDGDFSAAAAALEELLSGPGLAPDLERSALELAVWARQRAGDSDGVIEAYARFARQGGEPRKLLGAARLASAALGERGRAQEARAMFDTLLSKARGDRALQSEVLLESAWLAIEAKEADDAEASVRTAWKLGPAAGAKPALAEATFFAAELRLEAGDGASALPLYELAEANAAPEIAAQAVYKHGFANLRAERVAEAADDFARVLERYGASELAGESMYLLGECRARLGQWQGAVEPLERLVREQPRHASATKALFRLGVARGKLGQWPGCEAALVELARRAPDFEHAAEADLWRGRAAAQRGDARGAQAAFERVIAKDRGLPSAEARLELGRLAQARGAHEDALAQFLKVALLYESGEVVAEASFLAGSALEALGQLDKAKARYRELLEKQPKSPFATQARQRLDALAFSKP